MMKCYFLDHRLSGQDWRPATFLGVDGDQFYVACHDSGCVRKIYWGWVRFDNNTGCPGVYRTKCHVDEFGGYHCVDKPEPVCCNPGPTQNQTPSSPVKPCDWPNCSCHSAG